MTETKTVKNYTYDGFGFDLVIHDAPFVKALGEWVLDLDPNELQRDTLHGLLHRGNPFKMAELTFIRKSMNKTLSEFADIVGWSTYDVFYWEVNQSDAVFIDSVGLLDYIDK